jgi:hypothetical protein
MSSASVSSPENCLMQAFNAAATLDPWQKVLACSSAAKQPCRVTILRIIMAERKTDASPALQDRKALFPLFMLQFRRGFAVLGLEITV